jgi:hypothetical protein
MMMGAPVNNLGEGCSKDIGDGSYAKRPRGRPPKIGHFQDDVGPTDFAKVVLALGFRNTSDFRQYLVTVPRTIAQKTNTNCS